MSSRPSTPPLSIFGSELADTSEQVALLLQRDLEERGLGPGDRVGTEQDLAARYGVSRPTLREALRVLAAARLIRSRQGPGGGIFVVHTPNEGMRLQISQAVSAMLFSERVSLQELLDARLFLEVPLVGRAASVATAASVKEMEAAIEAADGHPASSDVFRIADGDFHRAIADAAGLQLVGAFTSWTLDVLQPSLVDYLGDALDVGAILTQHHEILRAVSRHRPRAAERAMARHLEYMREVLARRDAS